MPDDPLVVAEAASDRVLHMLADLVASRLVKPPLSIGLFGNWGTG